MGEIPTFPATLAASRPANFRGKPTGLSDYDIEFIRFLSTCKVAVCLENCTEENYFTEKFVNAVRAGCIPVYHAHESVKCDFCLELNGSILPTSAFRPSAR